VPASISRDLMTNVRGDVGESDVVARTEG